MLLTNSMVHISVAVLFVIYSYITLANDWAVVLQFFSVLWAVLWCKLGLAPYRHLRHVTRKSGGKRTQL